LALSLEGNALTAGSGLKRQDWRREGGFLPYGFPVAANTAAAEKTMDKKTVA
jgi:hypothetical protein